MKTARIRCIKWECGGKTPMVEGLSKHFKQEKVCFFFWIKLRSLYQPSSEMRIQPGINRTICSPLCLHNTHACWDCNCSSGPNWTQTTEEHNSNAVLNSQPLFLCFDLKSIHINHINDFSPNTKYMKKKGVNTVKSIDSTFVLYYRNLVQKYIWSIYECFSLHCPKSWKNVNRTDCNSLYDAETSYVIKRAKPFSEQNLKTYFSEIMLNHIRHILQQHFSVVKQSRCQSGQQFNLSPTQNVS